MIGFSVRKYTSKIAYVETWNLAVFHRYHAATSVVTNAWLEFYEKYVVEKTLLLDLPSSRIVWERLSWTTVAS